MTFQPPPQQPGQPGQPEWSGQQPPKKKRKKWPWILGILVVLIVIIAVSTSQGGNSSNTATTVAPSASAGGGAAPASTQASGDTLVYEVTGDGTTTAGNITFFSAGGQQSQETDATLPWSKELRGDKGAFTITGVTAQNGGDGGTIRCKITKNGKVEAENSSSGAYAVVSCNGKLF